LLNELLGMGLREGTRLLSNGVLVAIFLLFVLLGRQSPERRPDLLAQIERQVKNYLLVMLLISAATGILVGVTLRLLGVDFAWFFGFFALLLNFIPNLGSLIATLLPLPIAMLVPPLSVTAKVLVLIIPTMIQFSIGNLLAPKLQGDALRLHPVVVLMALIF